MRTEEVTWFLVGSWAGATQKPQDILDHVALQKTHFISHVGQRASFTSLYASSSFWGRIFGQGAGFSSVLMDSASAANAISPFYQALHSGMWLRSCKAFWGAMWPTKWVEAIKKNLRIVALLQGEKKCFEWGGYIRIPTNTGNGRYLIFILQIQWYLA